MVDSSTPSQPPSFAPGPGRLMSRFQVDFLESKLHNDVLEYLELTCHSNPHKLIVTHKPTPSLITLWCQSCSLHFNVEVHGVPDGQRACSLAPGNISEHFLVRKSCLMGSPATQVARHYHIRYNPVLAEIKYGCANDCAMLVTIQICRSLLPWPWIDSIINGAVRRAQTLIDSGKAPDNSIGSYTSPAYLLNRLLTVLHDMSQDPYKSDTKELKSLSLETTANHITFGESASLLLFLGFVHRTTPSNETRWEFPAPEPGTDIEGHEFLLTRAYYLRRWILELATEKNMAHDSIYQEAAQLVPAIELRRVLEGELSVPVPYPARDPYGAMESRYACLGVLASDKPEKVVYAAEKQVEVCPIRKVAFVQSLWDIHGHTNDELTGDAAVKLTSEDGPEQEPIVKAYAHFLAGTGNYCDLREAEQYPDEFFIDQAIMLLDSKPDDAPTHLAMIQRLCDSRQSAKIRNAIEGLQEMAATKRPTDPRAPAQRVPAQRGRSFELDLATAVKILELPSNITEATPVAEVIQTIESVLNSPRRNAHSDITWASAILSVASLFPEHWQIFSGLAQEIDTEMSSETLALPDLVPTMIEEAPSAGANPDVPTGLKNIGNTCYLNSALQYLYTLVPIHEILDNFDNIKLDLSPKSLRDRRVGYNREKVSRIQILAGQALATEMKLIFEALRTCPFQWTRPHQRLANAAMVSVSRLAEQARNKSAGAKSAAKLPAKPPVPVELELPSVEDAYMQHNDHDKPLANGEVSETNTAVVSGTPPDSLPKPPQLTIHAELEQGPGDTRSAVSSAKPPTDDDDVDMLDVSSQPTTAITSDQDPVEEEAIEEQLLMAALDSQERSGTDQQDITELLSIIQDKLQPSIQATGIKDGVQMDPILENLHIRGAYLRDRGDTAEVDTTRWISAFPSPHKKVSLHEALNKTFDPEFAGTQVRLLRLRHVPPLINIMVVSSSDGHIVQDVLIEIPLELCLDRYMENADVDMQALDLDLRLQRNGVGSLEEVQDGAVVAAELENFRTNFIDPILELEEPRDALAKPKDNTITGMRSNFTVAPPAPQRIVTVNHETINQKIDELWQGHENQKYLLHSVMCRLGSTAQSGHYWTFIHDVENGRWFKFNDETVTLMDSFERCQEQWEKQGNVYFISYVRISDKHLVKMPKREPRPEQVTQQRS